jgi:hypothetical protein
VIERRAAGNDVDMSPSPDRLLEIYLGDHLAAATAGVELVRRAARNNAGNAYGTALRAVGAEIEEDRRALQRVVQSLGFDEPKLKQVVARVGEKLGRLKLNGQVRGYSPLSRVLELEALSVGIAGKIALWESLQSLSGVAARLPDTDLAQLAERGSRQREEVEKQRLDAVREALGQRP